MLLGTTKCICGKELYDIKFDEYKPFKFDDRFYGGRVSMTGEYTCECGRTVKGYFEQKGNRYTLLNLELIKDITPSEKIENTPTSCVENLENQEQLSKTDEKVVIGINDGEIEKLSYNDMKKLAKEKGLKFDNNIKKNELIELLKINV